MGVAIIGTTLFQAGTIWTQPEQRTGPFSTFAMLAKIGVGFFVTTAGGLWMASAAYFWLKNRRRAGACLLTGGLLIGLLVWIMSLL